MRNAFRSPATWILLLALILLALCLLWLLPRLLQPPPAPATHIAAGESPPRLEAGLEGPGTGESTVPAVDDPSTPVPEQGEQAEVASSDPAEVPNPPGRILGRVVNSAGQGVAGVTVLAAHAHELGTLLDPLSSWITHLPLDVGDPVALGAEPPRSATTDESGNFGFEDFEPGRVRLAVRAPKHDPVDRNDLWLPAGGVLTVENVRIGKASRISGRIFAPDGLPILGAPIVRVDDFALAGQPPLNGAAGVLLGATNGRGSFETSPVGRGPWSTLVSGGHEHADLHLARDSAVDGWTIEATLAASAKIRGRLRTAARLDGPMVVRALPASAVTAGKAGPPFACRADARQAPVLPGFAFELGGLDPDTVYELRAGQQGTPWEVDSRWSPPVLAVAGEERAELAWDPDASVNFRIVAPGARARLGACEATLLGLHPESVRLGEPTDAASGFSTIEGLRPKRAGSYWGLRLEREGFLPFERSLAELRPGHALPLGDLELTPVPTMRVRVVDAVTEKSIEGARIVAFETPTALEDPDLVFDAVTDESGRARVPSFGGAGSGIEVRAAGYAPERRHGPFGAGYSEANLAIDLHRGASVRVRVVDGAGDPIAAARIEHVEGSWSPNERWRGVRRLEITGRPDPRTSRIVDARGATAFRHLSPGRHAFRVQRYRDYQDSEWTLRELSEGDSAEIVLISQAPARLDVRVARGSVSTDEIAGTPLALLRRKDVGDAIALLDARAPLPPGLTAILDERGQASFANLDPGPYVLLVCVPGQDLRVMREVLVKEGGARLDLDLAKRSIAGRVFHSESGPVPGAEIRLVIWDRRESRPSASRLRELGYLGESVLLAGGLDVVATTCDEFGRFELVGLPEGERYYVNARSESFWTGTTGPIALNPDGSPARADVSIEHAGAIEANLGVRRPIVPCVLTAVSRSYRSMPRVVRTYSGGVVALEGLEPGSWSVSVDAGTGESSDVRIEVVAGETAIVDLALP